MTEPAQNCLCPHHVYRSWMVMDFQPAYKLANFQLPAVVNWITARLGLPSQAYLFIAWNAPITNFNPGLGHPKTPMTYQKDDSS